MVLEWLIYSLDHGSSRWEHLVKKYSRWSLYKCCFPLFPVPLYRYNYVGIDTLCLTVQNMTVKQFCIDTECSVSIHEQCQTVMNSDFCILSYCQVLYRYIHIMYRYFHMKINFKRFFMTLKHVELI